MARQKMKTHSGTSKRFKLTGTGKLVRRKAGGRHLLTSKGSDRKRRLSGNVLVDKTMIMPLKRLLPYGL